MRLLSLGESTDAWLQLGIRTLLPVVLELGAESAVYGS
jgi:hypothetical protein